MPDIRNRPSVTNAQNRKDAHARQMAVATMNMFGMVWVTCPSALPKEATKVAACNDETPPTKIWSSNISVYVLHMRGKAHYPLQECLLSSSLICQGLLRKLILWDDGMGWSHHQIE